MSNGDSKDIKIFKKWTRNLFKESTKDIRKSLKYIKKLTI